EIELGGELIVTNYGALFGGLSVLFGLIFVAGIALALASAKKLIIGYDCVQLLSGRRVVVHIPYENVADICMSGDAELGVIGVNLLDPEDRATLVPARTNDSYEIHTLVYGMPPGYIYDLLDQRLEEFRNP